ncbi:hypothetical protein B0H13DRAFT_2343378 [Mycena leptocephala]|nr:hypothetical protein B0H13DRAFT_2343378 [Mycena leptocephala]
MLLDLWYWVRSCKTLACNANVRRDPDSLFRAVVGFLVLPLAFLLWLSGASQSNRPASLIAVSDALPTDAMPMYCLRHSRPDANGARIVVNGRYPAC